MPTSFEDMVAAARDGDGDALEAVLAQTRRWVYPAILRSVGNEHDAMDVLQDTLIVLYQRLPSLREAWAYRAWAMMVARARVVDHARRRTVRAAVATVGETDCAESGGSSTSENPETVLYVKELVNRARDFVMQMPQHYQEAFWSEGGDRDKEIAGRFDKSPETVRQWRMKARKLLEAYMSKLVAPPFASQSHAKPSDRLD